MAVTTTTHLNFRGNAREALVFYQSVFGGEVMLFTYAQAGQAEDPADTDQVIWGQVAAANGFRVMAYDVQARMAWNPGERAFFVSVRGDGADEITRHWDKLSEGATIVQPLGPSGWSPLYGMLTDRFGITWVMDVEMARAA
ncbi:VOC family protein [Tardiphaga sp.]|jgi:PhnB protein|uniref:VOC family protein n=1 Tax=Tardiphaga sp. TaxID=1926292 RepID=UPI0037DA378D